MPQYSALGETLQYLSNIGKDALEGLGDIIGIGALVANTLDQLIQQEQCVVNYAVGLYRSGKKERFAIYPTLITPNTVAKYAMNYLNDINNAIRHGIFVQTNINGRERLVYIGGINSQWINGVYNFAFYNGGAVLYSPTINEKREHSCLVLRMA